MTRFDRRGYPYHDPFLRAVPPSPRPPVYQAPPPPPPAPPPAPEPAIVPPISDERQALRKASADLDAARARVERDAARVEDETRRRLVSELLPVLDNLERAVSAGDGGRQGVELVRNQLERVLRGYGLERFEAVGERFDPALHEAVAVVDVTSRALDGTVIEQWQPGYRLGDRLMRPARVQVGRWRAAIQ